MLARCIQHENNHLDGITIMDRGRRISMRTTTRKMRRIDPALYISFPMRLR